MHCIGISLGAAINILERSRSFQFNYNASERRAQLNAYRNQID